MSSSSVREIETTDKRTKQAILDREADLVQSFKTWDEITTFSSLSGGGASNPTPRVVGSYLPIPGGDMSGRIGHDRIILTLKNNRIDVSKASGNNSGFILLNPEGGLVDKLQSMTQGNDIGTNAEMFVQIVNKEITVENFVSRELENIVGDGATNIITATIIDHPFETGDILGIALTNNFDIFEVIITKTGPNTFTYDLGAVGSPVAENNTGVALRGNICTPNEDDFIAPKDTIMKFIFSTFLLKWIFLSASNIAGDSGANINLSNLAITAINQSLNPNAAGVFDLGSDLLYWDAVKSRKIEFFGSLSNPTVLSKTGIRKTSTTMASNVDTVTDKYIWYFAGVKKWDMSQTSLGGANIVLSNTLTLNDSSLDSASLGQFTRNGSDVTILTSNGLKNMKDIGSGGANLLPLNNVWTGTNSFIAGLFNVNSFVINLGDSITDLINFNARINSSFVPINDGVSDLGTINRAWRSGYIKDSLFIRVSGSNPTENGQFKLVGLDVKVFSGNAIRNLSDIGTGGSGANVTLSNLSTTALNQDINMLGNFIALDVNKDSGISSSLDDNVTIFTGGLARLSINNTSVLPAVDIDMILGSKMINLVTPTNDLDAANKKYVDDNAGGGVDLLPLNNVWTGTNSFIGDLFNVNSALINLGDLGTDVINILGTAKFFTSPTFQQGAQFSGNIVLDNDSLIKSNDSTKIGYLVTNDSGSTGSLGTLQIPTSLVASGTAAIADGKYGAFFGAMGFEDLSTTSKFLIIRANDGKWYSIQMSSVPIYA